MQLSLGTSLLIIVPLILFALVTGTLVWFSDHKSRPNQVFLTVIGFSALWTILSIVSFAATDPHVIRFTSNTAAASSYWLLLSSFLFTQYFFRSHLARWIRWGLLPLSLPLTVLFSSNYTCGQITSEHNCTGGASYNLLTGLLLIFFLLIMRNCIAGIRSHNELRVQQARLMLYGFILAITVGITLAVFLPIFNITSFNVIYPISPIFFIAFVFYAIVRHKLFDIRAVIALTAGYGASILVLASLYGFIVFGTAHLVFGVNISWLLLIFLSATTGIAGLLFQRLRTTFDRTTSRVFYHDAYDPQELFHQLNKVLVSSLNLNYMLKQSARVLDVNMKAGFCYFAVRAGSNDQFEVAGTATPQYDLKEAAAMRKKIIQMKRVVVVADFLPESQGELKRMMDDNKMAVVVRLTQTPAKADEGLGFIVLGPKKSGNPYNGQDVRVLDTVANELIVAIQNALHFEEIQNFNVTLQNRVEKATRQLRSSNQKLKDLDETKDDFISMASHQLRTPLTSVKGYISMVMEGDAGKITTTQETMLHQAFNSSQRMVYLIADLLNVSRIKTGKFVIEPAPTDLSRVVQEEVAQLSEAAQQRAVTLNYVKPDTFPLLMLDETKIRQVIMNFIDNAIYYTPSGGRIGIDLVETPASVELKVVDNGIGVPKALQHNLFNKFYRAPNAQKARPDGTGLGLFMAKKVIVAEGGAIIFDSQEGRGSTFGFTFSKSKLAPPSKSSQKALLTEASLS